jgi:GTP cyclohydrolase II
VLLHLGISRVRLLTNNPRKVEALVADGIDVVRREPLVVPLSSDNVAYLSSKRRRLDHHLPEPGSAAVGTGTAG